MTKNKTYIAIMSYMDCIIDFREENGSMGEVFDRMFPNDENRPPFEDGDLDAVVTSTPNEMVVLGSSKSHVKNGIIRILKERIELIEDTINILKSEETDKHLN